MQNKAQLIAYVDRLGDTISGTREVIAEAFGPAFGGVHLLPFFPPFDGADAGFDPIDHTKVDPRLGSWSDVANLAEDLDVVVDVIVNHVSSDSAAFQDFVEKGDASQYADMFLTYDRVFPNGATETDLTTIYRPRPGLPFTPVKTADKLRLIWTTFTPQQIDIDVTSPSGKAYLDSILETLAKAKVSMVRLDAVGYAIKTPGTSCFMTPETFEFIDDFTARARKLGMNVLVEVHSHYALQIEIGKLVDRVYDFALPPLVLYGFYSGDAAPLREWIRIRPNNAITVLDTHDGIGVIDVGRDAITGKPGLLNSAQMRLLVDGIHAATGDESRQATGAGASNLDIYQINSTFYDAMARNDDNYLAARAIQVFLPGIPQIYYVGALAGHNDMELLHRTNVGRDINRHHYTREEIRSDSKRQVVEALMALLTLRNEHAAFAGEFHLAPTLSGEESTIKMGWVAGEKHITLTVDMANGAASIEWSLADGGTSRVDSLLDVAELKRR